MKSVVFLRGVNVGGKRTFQPGGLARALADFDAVSIGTAGTLVIHKPVNASVLLREIERRLPFRAEVGICTAGQLLDLLRCDPMAPEAEGSGADRHLSVLIQPPRKIPPVPACFPDPGAWVVQVGLVSEIFAVSLRRRGKPGRLYPNEVVERYLGVPATTRTWNTALKIGRLLAGE